MKRLLIAALAALSIAGFAHAGDIAFPSDAPIAVITFPEPWSAEETETGVQATSPEDAIYLSADVADGKSIDGAIEDAIKFLTDNGVVINGDSAKRQDTEVNGMPISLVDWTGKDKDGAASIGLAAVVLDEKHILVLTYWGTQGDEDKYDGDVASIIQSIRKAD
jgi:hypothetical protein